MCVCVYMLVHVCVCTLHVCVRACAGACILLHTITSTEHIKNISKYVYDILAHGSMLFILIIVYTVMIYSMWTCLCMRVL